jgi:ribosomal protein S18 acetylase RimI-like enzyme
MRMGLGPDARRKPIWPAAIGVRTFMASDAQSLHSLLAHGYRNGGGSVGAFDSWSPQMTTDLEFDPDLWFLAESHSRLAGAAPYWTSAFVKDLVVDESWRRRGLGKALLWHAFHTFATREASAVELKVEATNTGALALYERLGMRVVERSDLN